ncbi:MAG: ParA family protein [Pseudomonadota bacterium]
MKSLVFFNNKGGVGKTTLTCNVVSYLNINCNKRVLLVDADPQCNATQAILPDELIEEIYLSSTSSYKTLYSYLKPFERGEPTIIGPIVPISRNDNKFQTDIIPGHPNMSLIEDKLSRAWGDLQGANSVGGYRITNWLSQIFSSLTHDQYDLIIFDVGPSLGALNRTVLLSCDYVITPFGSDIFSLLGIKNISSWIRSWNDDYLQAISYLIKKYPEATSEFPGIVETDKKFKFAGFSVQQYVMRKFKSGARPVKAYDEIMKDIPNVYQESLKELLIQGATLEDLSLGHIPFLYSIVPLGQSKHTPIHQLIETKAATGSQVGQIDEYKKLMEQFCGKLLKNIGLK